MEEVVDPTRCTGCGACAVACPVQAITMEDAPDGFLHSNIHQDICIDCALCARVCPVINPLAQRKPEAVYAAQSPELSVLKQSASGGAFFEIARNFLAQGGSVYGAAMTLTHSKADIFHLEVRSTDELTRLQGSKYAQGRAYPSFKKIRNKLRHGERVLFSGLPCQVAGLKSYLRQDFENLATIDIFCHGNTSLAQLNCYLTYLKEKYHADIVSYIFRDKERGTGYKPKVVLSSGKVVRQTTFKEAYWYLFQNSKFYRESCYHCPYASPLRISDISLGDFWGIDKMRPELLAKAGGPLDEHYGISAVLANTPKGRALVADAHLIREDAALAEVSQHGAAIRTPQPMPADRAQVLTLFRSGNFAAAKAYAKAELGLYYYLDLLSDTQLVKVLKKLLSR